MEYDEFGIPFARSEAPHARPSPSVMVTSRAGDKPLVQKWWEPIKLRLAGEEAFVEEKNKREKAEIDKLQEDAETLEREMAALSKFLETQLFFLKDLELHRIDTALYIQKTQTHSVTWYKSIMNEMETNTSIQQKNPNSRSKRSSDVNTKGVLDFKKSGCVFTDSNTLANRRGSVQGDEIRKDFPPLGDVKTSAQLDGLPDLTMRPSEDGSPAQNGMVQPKRTSVGGPQLGVSARNAEDQLNLQLRERETSVLKTSAKRQQVQTLLAREQDTLQQDLEQLDHFIAAVSNNIIRLREIKDIFIVSVREKKRMIKVRMNTLTSRMRIYGSKKKEGVQNPKAKPDAKPKKLINPLTGFSSKNENPYTGGVYKLK